MIESLLANKIVLVALAVCAILLFLKGIKLIFKLALTLLIVGGVVWLLFLR